MLMTVHVFTMHSLTLPLVIILAILAVVIRLFYSLRSLLEGNGKQQPVSEKSPIEPLHNFDWKNAQRRQLRPFKPTYHITMGTFDYQHI